MGFPVTVAYVRLFSADNVPPRETVSDPIVIELLANPAFGIVDAAVTAPVPFPNKYPDKVVAPVPPLATGRVPDTEVVRLTWPHKGATPTPPDNKTFPVATSFNRASVVDELAYNRSPVVNDENPVPP